jgi:hypothetical protein
MHPRAAAPGDRHTAHAGVFSRRCFAGPRDTRLHTRGEKQELAFQEPPPVTKRRKHKHETTTTETYGITTLPSRRVQEHRFKMKSQVCRSAWDGARPWHIGTSHMVGLGCINRRIVRNGSDSAVAECTAYPRAAHSRDRQARQLFKHRCNALGP